MEPAYISQAISKTAQFMGTAELAAAGTQRGSAAMSPVLYYALPALGSYVMLSIFFLRRPRLLHTPWAPTFCPRLVAHRGGELGWGRGSVSY